MSPISTQRACAVPPAARIGPQKSIDRNSDPSPLFRMRTAPIPSSGATRTASVSTARPTLRPQSIASLRSPSLMCIFFATSTAIWIDALSLSVVPSSSRRSSSILRPLRYSSSNFSVLLAKSAARGISTSLLKSNPFDFASDANSYSSSARASSQF